MATNDIHRCSLCSFFCCKQDDFLNRVVRRHRHDANFIIHCSASACGVSFNNFRSFKNHVQRCHHECENVDSDRGIEDDIVPVCTVMVDNTDCSDSAAEAAYILTLKSKHRLSQNAIMDVCESTKELFRAKLIQMKSDVENCESADDAADSLFSGLDTHYKQELFFFKTLWIC